MVALSPLVVFGLPGISIGCAVAEDVHAAADGPVP